MSATRTNCPTFPNSIHFKTASNKQPTTNYETPPEISLMFILRKKYSHQHLFWNTFQTRKSEFPGI